MNPCTLTTEYSDQTTPAVDVALENDSGPQIPDFAIERMAKFLIGNAGQASACPAHLSYQQKTL